MLKAHYHKTVRRAKEIKTDYILAIQDKTTLNFTTHRAKTELGRIGGKGKKATVDRHERPIEEKHSYSWIEASKKKESAWVSLISQ